MADLQTVKIRDLIETQQVMTTDYMVLEKDTGTFKCQARYLKGATGLTPNVQVGNTTTLAPGQLATVTQRGNTENPVFDFGIPQGVQGQIGPQGPKGDTPDITPLQTQIDNRFNALTSQQQGSSEVIDARGGYPALKARLDAINDDLIKYNDQTIVTHTTESNFSSIDATKNGYLDNILLEGKTLVVDSNNQVVLPGTQGAILKSVGDDISEIKLNSINKNLADSIVLGSVNETDGSMIESVYNNRLNKIMVNPNTTYVFSKDGVLRNCNKLFYDNNDKYIGKDTISGTSSTFTTTSNTKYLVLTWGSSLEVGKYQLEKNIKTTYVDHIKNTKKVLYKDTDGTWKKPTLRQWDSIEKHSDGKYYYHKRSGNKNLNALTTIRKIVNYGDVSRFDILDDINLAKRSDIICDKLKKIIISTPNEEGINAHQSSDNTLQIQIKTNKLISDDVNGFKTWIQSNDVNFVYQLINEQVYECTPIDLISYDTQTNYSIECGPIYPKTTLKVNSYLGNVVSILKDKVSFLENMLVDGLKMVVAGNMQELAYRLYPQDFVDNVDDSLDMGVIE